MSVTERTTMDIPVTLRDDLKAEGERMAADLGLTSLPLGAVVRRLLDAYRRNQEGEK